MRTLAPPTNRGPRRAHGSAPLLCALLALVAGCERSSSSEGRAPGRAPSTGPSTAPRPRPGEGQAPSEIRDAGAGNAARTPPGDAGLTQPAATPRNLITPRPDLLPSPERFSFLVLGDSRENFTRCSPETRKNRPCAVKRATGPEAAALCERARDGIYQELIAALGPPAEAPHREGRPHAPPPRRDAFALHTGDLVYRGSCAQDWAQLRADLTDRLPAGRLFPAVGNHDIWQRAGEADPVKIFFGLFPALTAAAGAGRRYLPYYAFRAGVALVISLDTGGYPVGGTAKDFQRADREFWSRLASLEEQLRWLREVLAWGATLRVRHVFVQYHKPSFTRSDHPPLVEAHDPLQVLRPFKAANPGVNVIAFVGHNHTTELFVSGGVLQLVAGGSGAHQYLRTYRWGKRSQPPERFWAGASATARRDGAPGGARDTVWPHTAGRPARDAPRAIRYNVFRVLVNGPRVHLQERCLAWRDGRLVMEDGARIDALGRVTHRPGACAL